MHTRQLLPVFLAALLAVSMVASMPVATDSSSDVYDLDDEWGLADEDSVETFETDGVITATRVGGHDLNVTISESSDDVPTQGVNVDTLNTYVHFEYQEDIPREYRLYVPSEYFYPRVATEYEAENAPVTIDIQPAGDSSYSVVRIEFTGPTDATFKIGKQAGWVFSTRDSVGQMINDTTGISLPSIGSSDSEDEWTYVDAAALSGENATTQIDTGGDPVSMQYRTDRGRWATVPNCERTTEPVCRFERDGVENSTYIMSPQADPPQVRYNIGEDPASTIGGAWAEIREGFEETLDSIRGIFGGD